jgi:imidazolonepropionase-like amidohydrolase
MRFFRFLACALALLLAVPADAQAAVTAFVRVNVLPMDGERTLRDHVVIVSDGRIRAIGSGLQPPAGARIIDGGGTAWLLPGLADMHVHAASREELALMLANGITTALDMGEAPNAMIGRTRAAVERGEVAGPRLYAALAVDGSPRYGHLVVATPESARSAVRLAKANGYEFIKVYNGLSPEVFAALVAEAREAGLRIVGHNVESIGIERQTNGGQAMVAHLEEFLYGFFRLPEGADAQAVPEAAEIDRAIALLRRTRAIVTADLATFQTIASQWGRPERIDQFLGAPEARFLSPGDRVAWRHGGYVRRQGSLDARAAFLARFVKRLADAGLPIVAGTDAPTIPGLVSGFALHRNLAALEQAGLSRFQVIEAATRTPGTFIAALLPEAPRFGTIATGHRADLLLVAANPLDGLATLQSPLGVMSGGRWHDAASLNALLDTVARRYGSAAPQPPPPNP